MASFKIIPPHPDDLGMVRVRIAKNEMDRLGISSGDAVLVTGTRTTAAACVPLDNRTLPHDPEFLNDPLKLPVARLSDLTSDNAVGNNLLSGVEIEKARPAEAEKVTLSVRDVFVYRRENLELQYLVGVPFVRGDFIRITNREPQTKFPFVEFVVVDAVPDGKSHIITKDTKIDFASYKTKISNTPQLFNLKRKIRVGKKVSDMRLEMTLEFLEVYENGFKFFLEVGYFFDNPNEWVKSSTCAIISARDGIGNSYRCASLRQIKSQWSIGSPQRIMLIGIMVPEIKTEAERLAIEIKEITWQVRRKGDLQFLDQLSDAVRQEPTVVSIWERHKMVYVIAEGPRKFEIDLR